MIRIIFLFLMLLLLTNFAPAQSTVTGKVTGAHGKPMAKAHVFLTLPNETTPVRSVEADARGRYTLAIDSQGIWILNFSGVGFLNHRVALYLEKPQAVRLDVRLQSYRYQPSFNQVAVVGDFNRWHVLSAVPMRKQRDGTYAADVTVHADTVAYRLNGVRLGDAIEGTLADRYVSNGSGGYFSVLKAKGGPVRIVFDPRKLLRSSAPPTVTFTPRASPLARFAKIFDELEGTKEAYLSSSTDFVRTRGTREKFAFDWQSVLSRVEREMTAEPPGATRQELYLNYLTIAPLAKVVDPELCQAALREISPESIVWLLNPHSMQFALDNAGHSLEEREDYVRQVLDQNPLSKVKAAVLFNEFMVAKLSERRATADRYYDILVSQFGDTEEAKIAMGQH